MPKKHAQSLKTRKRRGKDLDEILVDQEPAKAARLAAQRAESPDLDLPGDGLHFCTPCQRHFTDATTLTRHTATKSHKQRLKALRETPFTQAEADAAAGLGIYTKPPQTKSKSKPPRPAPKSPMEADDSLL